MPAISLNIDELRQLIGDVVQLRGRQFEALSQLVRMANSSEHEQTFHELVLRCLERQEVFNGYRPVLDGLVRRLGLFPYLEPNSLDTTDQIAFELHRPVPDDSSLVFHKEQAEVFRSLLAGNSVVLSAPTSFGKSLIIDALVAAGRYRNVLLVVPTLALIDETRVRLATKFKNQYKIITHAYQTVGERNLFIFTQERAIEKLPDEIDLLVIDEFYKLSPGADQDDVRWNLLNQLFYRYAKRKTQFYLLGPSVKGLSGSVTVPLRFLTVHTLYQTVVSEIHKERAPRGSDLTPLLNLCRRLEGPTIIFCSSPARVAKIASALIEGSVGERSDELIDAADWLADNYHPDWHVTKGIRTESACITLEFRAP